jgi:iron complex transport system ATP-binding protein
MNRALNIKDLNHSYGMIPVLKNLSFAVKKSDFFIIIGPNGSGKTTLMKIIAGIIKPQKKRLEILGHPIETYPRKALAKIIAFVPQITATDFPFTVTELVSMGRSPYLGILGMEQEKDMKIARQAIAFTDIEHLAHRKCDQLSGGERQRAFISRAICQQPQIILLDEPTASLDLAHQVRIMDLMEKLKQKKGVTIIMISHDVNLAAMYADRLLLLKNGQIASLGTPDEVLTFRTLEDVYGCKLLVDESPIGKAPRVTLVPEKFINSDMQSK